VTGGAGFIGANVVRALADRGVQSVVIDNLSRPSTKLNLEWLEQECARAFSLVKADVRDHRAVEEALRAHADAEAVLHLAGQVAVTRSVENPREDLETNVVGTVNVLEATRRHAPSAVVVNVSSNKVYGDFRTHRIVETPTRYVDLDWPDGLDETHLLDPSSPYGCSKAAADCYTSAFAHAYGLRAISLRQSCVYGQRQFGVEEQGWVAWLVFAAHLGLPITVFGTGKQARDLLHVDDLVALYVRVVERADVVAGQAYNVGGGPANVLSVLELLERLGNPPADYADARVGDQKVFVADCSRVRADFGWEPATAVDDGLERLQAWVADHAAAAARVLQPT
jgi:CDP-paratose 2-epimerase